MLKGRKGLISGSGTTIPAGSAVQVGIVQEKSRVGGNPGALPRATVQTAHYTYSLSVDAANARYGPLEQHPRWQGWQRLML